MLIQTNKLLGLRSRPAIVCPYNLLTSFLFYLSPLDQPISESIDESTSYVSALIKEPNWEQSSLLKSLVSHMTPLSASKVIELNSNNAELGVRFFKWVCRHSTYCYDLDGRIFLLNSIVSSNLYAIAHKAIIVFAKEYGSGEAGILKLMGALEDMRKIGFRLSYPCYCTLLMCLAKSDMGSLAFWVYTGMVGDRFVPGVNDYRTIINALCKNGFVQAAEMFLGRMMKIGFSLDTHICTSLVLGNCREKDIQEAFRVFEIMSEEGSCGPNSVTYSVLIHGLCEIGKLQEAFSLKEEMSKKGCQPSTRTYTVLIKATCDVGLTDKALSLLDEMVAKGVTPNVHTCTVLVDRLCTEGKIDEANGMFRKMLKDGLVPSTVTYNALINGYCKGGRIYSFCI